MDNNQKTEKRALIRAQVARIRYERTEKERARRRNLIQWTLIIGLFVLLCAAWAAVYCMDAGLVK